MSTVSAPLPPSEKTSSDIIQYILAVVFGAAAAWLDLEVGADEHILLTALVVTASCMLLGFMRPHRPWRWVLIIGVCIPVAEWLAYFLLTQKPTTAQVYESFLAFLPGIAGAYGGALGRTVVNNLFVENPKTVGSDRTQPTARPKP
jgi:zinc transporter ZupT